MHTIKVKLTCLFQQTIQAALHVDCDPLIQPATRTEFGDYQANFALSLSKQLKKNPQQIAQEIIAQIPANELIEELSVAGPGFINIKIKNTYLDKALTKLLQDPQLGVAKASPAQTIAVDYGGANVAKEMHVGHLRSAVIGDAIVRVLSLLGHQVIRQNHLGDWGTQFGMLIEYLIKNKTQAPTAMGDLNTLYQQAKQLFDEDTAFAEAARKRVVLLQQGDRETLAWWQQLVERSEQHFQVVYDRLGVLLTREDNRGESFYNPALAPMVEKLLADQVAEISDQAAVIFLEGFVDRDQKPLPLLIRKGDGGYLYATTDLAAARYRMQELKANRLIYVTDARQKQHFAMLFAALKKAHWADTVELQHVPFGAILGPDRKPFKTRSGDVIKLVDLLDEAENRALNLINNKNPDLSHDEKTKAAYAIGIGALKYADLNSDKTRDYVFDWDQMLSFEGNTAPYLQNAYVRIQAVFRKSGQAISDLISQPILIHEPIEHRMALKLIEFPALIDSIGEDLAIHRLCHYLHELASLFHAFYEHCPILSAPADIRASRLLLSYLTAQTIALGLKLLGIETIERM